jgi:aspartate-semialdehyde dehydrogenase
MSKIRCAILGGSGYTAVELLKLLLRHPHAEVVAITSRQEAGKPVSTEHPSLLGRFDLPMENFDPDALAAKRVQCVFGCLPHGASMESNVYHAEISMKKMQKLGKKTRKIRILKCRPISRLLEGQLCERVFALVRFLPQWS